MKLDFQGRQSIVLALSGGIDSYVCAYAAIDQGIKISGFHAIMARPVAPMERSATKWLAHQHNFYLETTDMRQLLEMQVGYLPFANIAADEYDVIAEWGADANVTAFTMLLNCMMYYTQIAGHDGLAVGLTKEQAARRDASGGFIHLENMIAKFNPGTSPPKVVAPLIGLSKQEIIQVGLNLGVPFDRTWSCISLQPTIKHCGVCAGCQARKAGFLAAGLSDPTQYA